MDAKKKKLGGMPPAKGAEAKQPGKTGKAPPKKNFKTYSELVEEEEKKKRERAELEAEDRAQREARKRFWAWTQYIPTPKRVYKWTFPVDFHKRAILKLGDALGKMQENFKSMHVLTKSERCDWFKLWCEMDKTMSNQVSYMTFCRYFNMSEDMWSRRMYDIANDNLNGSLQFTEFLGFCRKYLYIDRQTTEEFSFRMISRRGSTFKPKLSVLDLEDLRQFVRFRFKMKEPKEIHKRALDVLNYVDTDGDGSLYLDEFELFTKRNCCFVRFTHLWQQHMRKAVFGIKYWVTKSRHIKSDNAKGTEKLTLFHRINLESENFCRNDLDNPVVDDRGRVVVTLPYVPNRLNFPDSGTQATAAAASSSSSFSSPQTSSAALPMIPGAAAAGTEAVPPLPPLQTSNGKNMLAWHGPLSAEVNLMLAKPYELEFAEVHIMKLEAKARRREQKMKDNALSRAVAAHTYKRLVSVCEDLIYGRKWLRLAFDHWIDTVGVDREETLVQKHSAEEKRLVARKRMAKLITKENIKEISLRYVSEDNLAKIGAQETAAKEAAMFGPRGGLEAVAAKLEEQGITIDDMHSRIVDNCLKQEEQLDDPDNQCAAYMRSVFMRDHLANMHGYRRDRLSKFAEDLQEHTHPEEVRRALREPRALPAFNYKQRMLYADESDVDGEDEGEDF